MSPPETRDTVRIPIPSSCLDGGYDLSGDVARLLAAHGSEASGNLDCLGWQSTGHAQKDRCTLEMRYRIRVR